MFETIRDWWDDNKPTDSHQWILLILVIGLLVMIGLVVYSQVQHITGIKEGTVISKQFEPAGCIMIPHVHTVNNVTYTTYSQSCHGDRYTIWYADENKKNYDYVSPADYQTIQLGDYFDSRAK
jgi:hypothetical protein